MTAPSPRWWSAPGPLAPRRTRGRGWPRARRTGGPGLALELSAARALAVLAWPLLPDFGARLHAVLAGEPVGPGSWNDALEGAAPGRDLAGLRAEHFPDVRRRFVRVPAPAQPAPAETASVP